MTLVENAHLDVIALKALLPPYPATQEHIMVAMKQLVQVHVGHALKASSAIHLASLLLTGNVQLDITVQLGSRLAHHHHLFVLVEVSVPQALAVLQNASLDTIKMNSNKTLARNALNDITAMQHLVELRITIYMCVQRGTTAPMEPVMQRNSHVQSALSTT